MSVRACPHCPIFASHDIHQLLDRRAGCFSLVGHTPALAIEVVPGSALCRPVQFSGMHLPFVDPDAGLFRGDPVPNQAYHAISSKDSPTRSSASARLFFLILGLRRQSTRVVLNAGADQCTTPKIALTASAGVSPTLK